MSNKILSKVSEDDAKELTLSIIEVEVCHSLYNEAMKDFSISKNSLQVLLEYYMHVLKAHKTLWKTILIKYLNEDDASRYEQKCRFDTIKHVIFLLDCESCSNA